ncbi:MULTISPECIES: molybdopterin-dependent oxidoreductase [unclassified Adlercreutzia]|uniref:molybdopterin-containing oxidoreductase family protein n=1 Tax=unclassified Adlercreutzia TaxID=2636013 RepID=UPI0013EB8E2E|nr:MULTISPECIES: molybdopterin-dependent oxidoreductase [unclassified Adlercreutzia]
MSETKITYHPCQGYGCHERCLLETHTRDGKITRVQKAVFPHKVGPGVQICQKGIASCQVPYNEDRLLYPMKRTGERGEGKFERISWDQAISEISAKINESAEKYGPRSIVMNLYYCGIPASTDSITHLLGQRYLNTFGASKLEYEAVDYAIVEMDVVDEGMAIVGGRYNIADADNLVIIWGGNPLGFTRPARLTHMVLDAKERGARLVHISNLYDNTSAKADEWVPVRSGTDAALALGMAHVIVRDYPVNEEFLLGETAAAYLVNTETHKYVRASEVFEGGSPADFVFCDEQAGALTAIPRFNFRHEVTYGDAKPALEHECEIGGVVCKSSYTLLKEHLQKWTPEAAENACGVPAAQVEHLAKLYYESSPSLIAIGDGLRYSNGTQTIRAIKLLTYLTGNHGAPNGGTIISAGLDNAGPHMIDRMHIRFPEGLPTDLGDYAPVEDVINSVNDPEAQQYKVLLNMEGNPLLNWPNKELWCERILPVFDLVVACEIRMTDTCRWADYILPEATTFERHEVCSETDHCVVLCEPAIEPLGESRTAADIYRALAESTGVGQYFQKTQEEWAAAILDENPTPTMGFVAADEDADRVGEVEPVTYERLKKQTAIHLDVPDDPADPYAGLLLHVNETGRIQFYSEAHAMTGDMLADLQATHILDEEMKKKYPLHLFIARHKYFMQGQFTNIPEMEKLAYTQFGVALNPKTAQERGLRDGDEVEVFNDRGVMRSKLILREDVAPGIAHTWYSFPETYYPDTDCPQVLATPQNAPETATPMSYVNGALWDAIQVACGSPATEKFASGFTTPEVIFDQLCEVRKAVR